MDRLKAMHAGLHAWDSTILKKPKKRLRKAQRELEELMRGPINTDTDQQKFELPWSSIVMLRYETKKESDQAT
jgi:hypothetical protein